MAAYPTPVFSTAELSASACVTQDRRGGIIPQSDS
jgi:hypothetical protein